MSGEQQDKQRAIEAAKQAGLHNDGADHVWYGNPKALKGQGGFVEVHIGEREANLRASIPNDALGAMLNPVTKEYAEKAQEAVMADLDGRFWAEEEVGVRDALSRLIALLFPKSTPTDTDPS